MKKNENGDFCVLYLEPSDDKTTLLNVIIGQQKPVVIILLEHLHLFQRPEDFTALKHVKRQLNVPLIFVIPGSEQLAQLASRNGFPVYSSMESLTNALAAGHLGKQRVFNKTKSMNNVKTTVPLAETAPPAAPRKTVPLMDVPAADVQASTSPPFKETRAAVMPPIHDDYWKQATRPQPVAQPMYRSAPPKQEAPVQSVSKKQRKRSRLPVAMLTLMLIALALAGTGSLLIFSNKLPTTTSTAAQPATVGSMAFLSSEQLSENSSQGIADQVVVDLNNLSAPAPGKAYYAWLLGDKNQGDVKTIALGSLQINKGHAHLFYPGDAQHTNLLSITSRFLVTEEDATMPPITPSPDQSTWRYYGEFSQTPVNLPGDTQHYSYLDHLRHLLASDPTLDDMELPGGLNNWFYRNSGKILEWTGSMREQWENRKDVAFVRRQTMRTLTYLDGLAFVQQDLPPKTPILVDERLARVGLLEVAGPNQDPACYLGHIDRHLSGLLLSSNASPATRKQVAAIEDALNNVKFWLNQVRQDGLKIMKMSNAQLTQPATLSLINDMIANANAAYVGQIDPNTGQMRQGVVWIHQQIQSLATLDIATFNGHNSALEMVPDTWHFTAFHQ